MAPLDKMILSASGWRGVFAATGGEEDNTDEISEEHKIMAGAAALVFAKYLGAMKEPENILVLVGADTRPTSKTIVQAIIPVLLAFGCRVQYAGITAAPEIMAWARLHDGTACGFMYVSASHNPIGHNGLKFGLTDGGVLPAREAAILTANFRLFFDQDDLNCAGRIKSMVQTVDQKLLQNVYSAMADVKLFARKAYYDFCTEVVWGGNKDIACALKDGLKKRPLGIVCDFNGSARTVSIDRDFFSALGIKLECINEQPGEIVHRIVPEGESLEPCRVLLEKAHARDASFLLGYLPDCDGDRGNLVIWDRALKAARCLEAQEVFALACLGELLHLVWTGELTYDKNGNPLSKAAIAVNDATSMRIDRIAEAFGVEVFRAEVGEANVVALARFLREKGYIVRIMGEGAAGGNITHPAAVRDPINTVMALVKLLCVRETCADADVNAGWKSGLFRLWCNLSGQMELYREDFCIADIIASLPPFVTTSVYSEEAILHINTKDHSALKSRYQEVFLCQWEERKDMLKTRFGIYGWEASAFNGTAENHGLINFTDAGNGGLKICFRDCGGRIAASIWMRGSATEPVFRILADSEGADRETERDLLQWQRRMIIEADRRN